MSETVEKKSLLIRTMKLLTWIAGSIVFLFVLVYLLLQIPFIQNYLGKKVTTFIGNKTQTEVSLHSVAVSLTKGLKLQGLDVSDQDGPLGKIGALNISLLNSLYSLRNRKLDVRRISIDDSFINWWIKEGEKQSNFEKFINKIAGPTGNSKSNSDFNFDLKRLAVNRTIVDFRDENKNSLQQYKIKNLMLGFEVFEPQNRKFIINDLKMEEPEFVSTVLSGSKKKANNNNTADKKVSPSNPLYLKIINGLISQGKVSFNDLNYPVKNSGKFDSRNFSGESLQLSFKNFLLDEAVSGEIDHLSFNINGEWILTKLKAEEFVFGKNEILLRNYALKTPRTLIQNSLSLNFEEGINILKNPDQIKLAGELADSYINLEDLSYFIPNIFKSPVLRNIAKTPVFIDSKISGSVNDFDFRDLKLFVKDKINYSGDISINNVTNENISVKFFVDNFKTSVVDLKEILPAFKPSQGIQNLNNLNYSGLVNINRSKLGISGVLNTDLGNVEVEMDMRHSGEQLYTGSLSTNDFNLGKLAGIKDLGRVSVNLKKIEANGTDFNTSRILLDGDIKSIDFKNNIIRNIIVDGILDKGNFEGRVLSNDPDANFDFDGIINQGKDKIKVLKFYSAVERLDLFKLGFTKKPFILKGNFDLDGEGKDINSFTGSVRGDKILLERGDSTYRFNTIDLTSGVDANNVKNIKLKTEGIDINVEGNIDYTSVLEDTKLVIASNFPYYSKDWKLNKTYSVNNQDFRFDIFINSIAPFDELFNLRALDFTSLRAKGNVNTAKNEINIVSSWPWLQYKNEKIYNGSVFINLLNKSGEVNLHSDSSYLQGYGLNSFDIDSKILGDKISISLSSTNLMDSIGRVELRSEISPHPKGYVFKVLNSDLRIYNRRWKFSSENSVAFGKEFIEIKNFNISDGNRTLEFTDINNKGVLFKANKFRFDAINTVVKDKKFQFDGEVISSVRMNDIFEKSPDIYGTVLINNMTINKDSYGDVNIDVTKPLNENLKAIISIDNPATKQSIKSILDYDTRTKMVNGNIKGRKVPLKWLEYILKDGIKNMKGDVDVDGTINGVAGNLKIRGEGIANNGSVKVVYLGETYTFHNEKFSITENNIDLTGARLFDSERNSGVITGGLRHTYFKDFILNANIESPKIIALNTTKADNPIYYGIGKGQVNVDITGPTSQVNMVINATTGAGTILNIPISESSGINSRSLITFVDREAYKDQNADKVDSKVKVEGMQIEMNVAMTPEAQVNMIFDERVNDVIRGNGTGNIRIFSPRIAPLEMYGTFEIQKGEYLFTAKNVLAKPFTVKPGGTIRWTGDPINATLNIEADYQVRTGVSTFLEEFLYTDDLRSRASTRTAVNVTLIIGNTLYKPSINFNLDFPELTGELKNYAATKTRLLKNNEADFNGQIFTLIIANTFLPNNALNQVVNLNNISAAGINTLSEFISNQFSHFVTSVVNQALTENGLVSGIDFNLTLRNNMGLNASATDNILPTEIEVRLGPKFKFLNDRFDINFGSSYIRPNANQLISINQDYVVPDFYINYEATSDGKLNLRLYGRYDFDEATLSGRRQIVGLGLRYRNEFGNMLETKSDLTEFLKKSVRPSQ